ncbi:MAG: LysM peptidoglycan-binding domain-containing protein [Gemmatimonadota bacterium]|nr:LysM peptidoglycan-binding domain-containing protein [Gemmatimonadota bacterium]
MRRALIILIASLSALAPATAQQSDAPRTYTVREGDTLWAIAERFLKDPLRWAEVHKKNADKIRDPHWIYPGQVIDLVDLFGAALDSTTVESAGATPVNEPSIFAVRRAAPAPVVAEAPVAVSVAPRLSRALGEAAATPYLVGLDGVRATGAIGRVTASELAGRAARDDRPIQAFERVALSMPTGMAVAPDDRFVTFRYGPTLKGRGRVVIPTGVLRVIGAGANGTTEAQLVATFESVQGGQSLVPLDTLLPDWPAASPLESGPAVTVLWVEGDALIPTTGQEVILSAPADGSRLRPGDQVTFTGRAAAGESALVATLRVVKVTPQGATARVVSQGLGRLERGMNGRVSARVP